MRRPVRAGKATRIVGSVEGTAANDRQGGGETAHGAAGIRVLVSFAVGVAAFGVAWLATPWQPP